MDKGAMFLTLRVRYSSEIPSEHTSQCLTSFKAQPFYSIGKDIFMFKLFEHIYCAYNLPFPSGLRLQLLF